MAKNKAVWGIDIGHCALKALKLVVGEEDQIEVVGEDYIEHAKILSQPDADPHELISKSLEKFLSHNDITEDLVAISVPGQHTLARFSKLPPVDPKKIPDIVQFEANQQIPFDMDEVIWDYQTFAEEDSPEIEVGIFAMKRDLIHEHLAHFSDAGIEPMLMQAAPLAAHDAILFNGLCGDETTVLVDIGAENTDLVVTDKVRIWTRTIPIGGNKFTEALANGFKLSFAKAENLKQQASASKYARQIFQAMRPVFADLVGEIQRSIGFYTSTHREAKLNRMVGMGNAFRLPGLQKYLQQNLGMTVTRPSEFKGFKSAPGFARSHEENVLSFVVAAGLALEGLDRGHMHSNLLPPEIARQVTWRKKKPWFAAAAACLLASAGMVWFRYSADLGVLQSNRGGSASALNYATALSIFNNPPVSDPPRVFAQKVKGMADAFVKKHNSLKGMGKSEADDCERILDLLRDKSLWPMVLETIHRALPAEAQLASAMDGVQYVQILTSQPEALARPQRKEVFIESLSSQFVEDIYAIDYRTAESAEEDPEELFDYYSDEGPQGFIMTLACRTPNEGRGKFIEEQNGLIQKLKTLGQAEGQEFYFDGVRLVTAQQGGFSAGASRPAASRPAATRSRGRGAMGGGSGGGATASSNPAFGGKLDALTFENVADDWKFSVKFVVALDDLPEEKSPGTPEAEPAGRAPGGRTPGGRGGRGG